MCISAIFEELVAEKGLFVSKFTRPELTAGMATTSMPEWPELML